MIERLHRPRNAPGMRSALESRGSAVVVLRNHTENPQAMTLVEPVETSKEQRTASCETGVQEPAGAERRSALYTAGLPCQREFASAVE
jgi:hypothetical protein